MFSLRKQSFAICADMTGVMSLGFCIVDSSTSNFESDFPTLVLLSNLSTQSLGVFFSSGFYSELNVST